MSHLMTLMRKTLQKLRLVALLLLSLVGGLSVKAALNGSYTINAGGVATATNYLTVSSAVSDLMTGTRADGGPANGPGVSGAVTLRITPGSGPYTEQVSFGAIPGATATTSVRLTGGPTREAIQFANTTTTDRHVIRLSGAKHIKLDSLTLINTGVTYGYGVWFQAGADSNFVTNSHINVDVSSAVANFCGITMSGASPTTNGLNGSYNTIQGNVISGGYYGISNNGNGTTPANYAQGNQIVDNEIKNFYYYGLRHYGQNRSNISGNTVHARASATASGYGMYIYYNDNFNIERNRIYDVGTYGIYTYFANYQGGAGTSRARIVNNMIGGGFLNTAPYGIYMSTNCTRVDLFHNSVSMNGGTGRCMYILSGTLNDIRNNVLSYTGSSTGYALYVATTLNATTVDYNDYYAPGSSNFVFIGVAYTPGTYIGGGGYNLNSLNVDPLFVNSASDLHIATGLSLYDAGANVGVTNDFDNQVRPLLPSTGYDIGADEFLVLGNDAGVDALTNPTPPFSAGVYNVNFTIHNYGLANLTSATVNWRMNGALQTPYAWSGSLVPGATSTAFTAGTYNFLGSGPTHVEAWTSSPNASIDGNIYNDTLDLNVCSGMSGTYTIGGLGADFPTLNAAKDALICGGVAGPVTFNLTQGAGPFNEQVIIPAIAGASAVNTIRFNGGATRETVQFTGTTSLERAVIKLNGADHIILDSLTIINNDPALAHGVHLTNNADSNVIKNCLVVVNQTSTATNFAGICITGSTPSTAGANGNGNLILNNEVNGGYYGIVMQGLSTTVFDQNNAVIGNTLKNTYYYPIRCYSQNNVAIRKNTITVRANASTTSYMIYMYYADNFDISKNNITRGGGYGIYSYYGNYQGGSSTTRARIVNNMIGGNWLGNSPYGIYLSTNSVGIDIFHNSVSITSGAGRCLYVTSGSGNDIRNNSFSYTGSTTGYAAYVSLTSNVSGMDYNNYYCPGSSNFIFLGSAFSPSTYVGGAGFNLSSRDGDPNYLDPQNDLHARATQLFDGGSTTTGVQTDFDDEVRPNPFSTVPDIGADEYRPDSVNIATTVLLQPTSYICPDSNQVIKAVIVNKGTNPISNIAMTAEITGQLTTTLNVVYPGPLTFGASDTVTLGTINTWPGGTFDIKVYNSVPNDQNLLDDSLSVSRFINQTPGSPTAVGDTICAGDSAMLVSNSTNNIYWYDAISGGNLVGAGATLNTGPLAATTNFYVEARGFATNDLVTTFSNNNSCGGGNMFDINALTDVTIDSLDLHLQNTASVSTVSVYYRVGSYVGNETNSGAWTLLGTTTVTSAGIGTPTRAVIGGLTIPSGSTYGIYVFNANVVYTSLAATYSSPDMTVTTGAGLCSQFGGVNVGRTWNGRIYYTAEGCASQRTAVTVDVNPSPIVALNDTAACGSLVLDAGNAGATYQWSNGVGTQTSTINSSGTYAVTVTNAGCTTIDSAAVAIFVPPVVNLGPDILLCDGATGTIDAGNAGLSFAWTTGASTQTISVTLAGLYAAQVTDSAGCQDDDTVAVATGLSPLGSISIDTSACPLITFTGGNTGGAGLSNDWTFGDGGLGTGANPSHTYTANGTYTVSYQVQNDCGTSTVQSTITISCLVGTTAPNGTQVLLYPNPTRSLAALELNLPAASDAEIQLMDLHGRVIQQISERYNAGNNKLQLDLSTLSAGVYVVQVVADGLHWQGKIVKE